jgi:hypothetical protein
MSDDPYGDALGDMQDRVDAAIAKHNAGKAGFVKKLQRGERLDVLIYSAYNNDKDTDIPIDNLDEIPHRGTFVVVSEYESNWDYTGNGELYISEPITDPTWLDIALFANESIHVTGDYHHVFLESVEVVDNGKALKLWFGS